MPRRQAGSGFLGSLQAARGPGGGGWRQGVAHCPLGLLPWQQALRPLGCHPISTPRPRLTPNPAAPPRPAPPLPARRPDAKTALYQSAIKQGDLLLNRLQKLSKVIDIE